jgi:hypothetical protein
MAHARAGELEHKKGAIVQQKAQYVDVHMEIFPLQNEDSPAEHSIIFQWFFI